MAKIQFTECNIPLTRDNLIQLSKDVNSKRFYIKTLKCIRFKHEWDESIPVGNNMYSTLDELVEAWNERVN